MKILKLIIFGIAFTAACKTMRPSSRYDLQSAPTASGGGCARFSADPSLLAACDRAFAAVFPKIKQQVSPMIEQQFRMVLGDPMTIVVQGKCLREGEQNFLVFDTCVENDPRFRWYLASMEGESTAPGNPTAIRTKLFYLVSRQSAKDWLLTSYPENLPSGQERTSQQPRFRCVDMRAAYRPRSPTATLETGDSIDLKMSDCAQTRLMFLAASNNVAGDPNHIAANSFLWLFAIDLNTPASEHPLYARLRDEMAKRKPVLTRPCDHQGCLSAANNLVDNQEPTLAEIRQQRQNLNRFMEQPVEWGPLFTANKRFFYFQMEGPFAILRRSRIWQLPTNTQNTAKVLIGGCTPQHYHEEKPCFEGDAKNAVPLFINKSLSGAIIDRYQGPVVQLIGNNGTCLTWNSGEKNCTDPAVDKASGDESSQFRVVFVATPPGSADQRPRVKLQRIVNLLALPRGADGIGRLPEPPKCLALQSIDGKMAAAEVPCCAQKDGENGICSTKDTYVLDEKNHALAVDSVDANQQLITQSFTLNRCINASTDLQGLAYDCRISPHRTGHVERLENLAHHLGWIPVVGNIADLAIYGVLCHQAHDLQSKTKLCGQLGISIGTMVYSAACIYDSAIVSTLSNSTGAGAGVVISGFAADPVTSFMVEAAAEMSMSLIFEEHSVELAPFLLKEWATTKKQGLAEAVAAESVRHSSREAYGIDSRLAFSDRELNDLIKQAMDAKTSGIP